MKRYWLPAVLATVTVLITGPPVANAQTMCAPRRDVLAYLGHNFGEVRQSVALTDSGAVLEVLVSPQGTWTMIVTTARGEACVLATGQHWQPLSDAQEPAA
jgi:hypothetical protein